MNSFTLAIILSTLFAGFFKIRLLIFSLINLALTYVFWLIEKITTVEFIVIFSFFSILTILLNIKQLRRNLITKHFFKFLLSSENNWQLFARIDNGWLASELEQSIFQGKPSFPIIDDPKNREQQKHKDFKQLQDIIESNKGSSTLINALSKKGFLSLLTPASVDGKNHTPKQLADLIKNTSKIDPVLASVLAMMNLESVAGLVHQFGSKEQKSNLLPQFNQGKMVPYLIPTTLFETLESQKTTIEGRLELQQIKGKEILGVRVSFKYLIMLGIQQSNCFHLHINVKDFNNVLGPTTNLGTAVCLIDKSIKGLKFKKGHPAYDKYLKYYSCTGDNLFIPISNILSGQSGLGKGLEYIFRSHCFSCNIWPLAVSTPTQNLSTLTSWYFAHIQKQNSRQLLSYKVVIAKLNDQFSQVLRNKLIKQLLLNNNLSPQSLKFSTMVLKNKSINETVNRLSILRDVLGSNSHNIKQESKLRKFYKVSQLTAELGGMSHEINLLPLIKKAALACHPYYDTEVKALLNPDKSMALKEFDTTVFKHLGYIFQNLCKVWFYSLKTSFAFRIFFSKSKYKDMIKRLSASFAFITDVSLLRWTIKSKVNTSFASYIGDSMVNITQAIVLNQYYDSQIDNRSERLLTKNSLKNSLYDVQQSIKENINLAFGKPSGIFLKLLIFPLGRPFHSIKMYQQPDDEIDQICKSDDSEYSPITRYSPFLDKIYQAKIELSESKNAETAVTNATGTAITTDNYELLINRCLAAGILSIEQSENLRKAYQKILEIQLTNHFGSIYEKY